MESYSIDKTSVVNTISGVFQMMQWIYTEYLNVYTQYLGYFASVLVLLTSAIALSIIRVANEKQMCWVKIFFCISFVLSVIDLCILFEIYDGLRTMLLLMSGQCTMFDNDIACDINMQGQSTYLKVAIIFAILSLTFLILGYLFKVRSADAK